MDKKLKASFTIEASLVMPVVLFSLAALITSGFRLHDIVLGNLVANEVAELYGHLPESENKWELEAYGSRQLECVLSDISYSIEAEDYKDGTRVELIYGDGERRYEDAGFRPEKMMRRLTLADVLLDD